MYLVILQPGLAIKIGMNMFCNETNLEKVQIIFQTLAVNEEPLLIVNKIIIMCSVFYC